MSEAYSTLPTADEQGYDEALAEAVKLGLMTTSGNATNRSQCPTCLGVFTTESNFDRHLAKGRNAVGYAGEWCVEPSTVGLVQHERGWWQQPGSSEFWAGSARL